MLLHAMAAKRGENLENWFFNWPQYRDIPLGLPWRHGRWRENDDDDAWEANFAWPNAGSIQTFNLIHFIIAPYSGHRPHSSHRGFASSSTISFSKSSFTMPILLLTSRIDSQAFYLTTCHQYERPLEPFRFQRKFNHAPAPARCY